MKLKTEKKEEVVAESHKKIAETIVEKMAKDQEKRFYINHSVQKRVGFFGGIYYFFRSLFILAERIIKIIAIFALSLSASILFLVASFYLFSATFGLKDSPAFQVLRDHIGTLYAAQIEEEISDAQKDKDWKWERELEEMKKDIKEESGLKKSETADPSKERDKTTEQKDEAVELKI